MEENKKPENPCMVSNSQVTLRDDLASKAMQSFIIASATKRATLFSRLLIWLGLNGWTTNTDIDGAQVVKASYSIADDMLKQREL